MTALPAQRSAAPESDAPADLTFAGLGVPAPLVEVLAEDGIAAPFPVQAATLPDALAGRDILGRARTGSGKTLGFSLPLVTRLADGKTAPGQPRGLVLVPTRELATQVQDVLRPLARAMDLRVTTIYGGVSYGPQVNALQRRTDIVVATPGRLADLISQGECDLSEVGVTVIDEADQMADLGFLPIVRRLLETTPGDGQRMLFSATLDAAVDVLARRFLHDPVLHSVDENSSPAEIEHHVLTIAPGDKVAVVASLAGGEKRSLVFTRTKHGAERLARQLTEAGIPAAELHGNLRQGARSRNLAAFATGIARVMVATDIAARGIHIDGIDLVIHADPPAEHKAYVHRSGRTARGGADGVVVTMQTKGQAGDVTAMMRKAGIVPHQAVAAAPDSDVLRGIAGEPAPRVSVPGKVAELVKPEDRFTARDRGGAGRSSRPGDRGERPRRDRNRDRTPRGDRESRGFARRDAGQHERPRRSDRDARPAGFDRDQQPARFDRDQRPARGRFNSERLNSDRPQRLDRGNRGSFERSARFEGNDRAAGGRLDSDRPQRFARDDRSNRGDRFDRPARFGRDERPARFERPARGDQNFGDQNFGDRGFGDRGSDNRGFGDRQERRATGDRFERQGRFDRADRSARDDARHERNDRQARNGHSFGDSAAGGRTSGDRGSGGRTSGDRSFGGRTSGNRSFGGRRAAGSGRDDSRDFQRPERVQRNDWYPQGTGNPRPRRNGRAGGPGNRTGSGRSFGGRSYR